MKPHSLSVLSLVTALLAVPAAAETAYTYIAPGVNVDNPAASSAFYDNGKGAYFWKGNLDTVGQLYRESGNSFSFMGDLQDKVVGNVVSADAFANLVSDRDTCWYNSASNVLQYWQNYYGFAQDPGTAAPDGYTYSPSLLEPLGGTQSLQIDMLFYENTHGPGGTYNDAFDWYLKGTCDERVFKPEAQGRAGFYSTGFQGKKTCFNHNFFVSGEYRRDMTLAAEDFKHAFGVDSGTAGQIASISLYNLALNAGHEITCYGFTLDAEGQLESIYIADNQDGAYQLQQVFLRLEGDVNIHLYLDREFTRDWMSDGYNWNLREITAIETPDALKTAYRDTLSTRSDVLQLNGGTLSLDGMQGKQELSTLEKTGSDTMELSGLAITATEVEVAEGALALTGGTQLDAGGIMLSGAGKVTLEGESALNYGTTVKLTAAQGKTGSLSLTEGAAQSSYTLGTATCEIENATITVTADEDKTISNRLKNVTLVNGGSGTLTADNAADIFADAVAKAGGITFLNTEKSLTLSNLAIGQDLIVSVYVGTGQTEDAEGNLHITGSLTGMRGSRLNANLWLVKGAMLNVSDTQGMGITMGSDIHLASGMLLSEADLAQLGETDYALFSGVDALYLGEDTYTGSVDAQQYFTNLAAGEYRLEYANRSVYLSRTGSVPEPATGTLTLLSLAALVTRRRRK